MGDAVLSAFVGDGAADEAATTLPRVVKLAVRDLPGSGKPAELLEGAAGCVVAAGVGARLTLRRARGEALQRVAISAGS